MGRERVLLAFIVSAVMLVVFGLFKPDSPDPRENNTSARMWFFINKTHQKPEYNLVVIGDSRALRGVSPTAMEPIVENMKIFNFAFHAGGMNKEIYSAAEEILVRGDGPKAILLAPTALSFLPIKLANSQFHEYRSKPRDVVWLYRYARWISEWFQPVAPGLIMRNGLGDVPSVILEEKFYANGWIATSQTPTDELADLTLPRKRVSGHRVDRAQISEFMNQTRIWRSRGIAVFAFFPPAYPPRIAMEDSVLGFEREEFIATFVSSGGSWLDIGQYGYDSYDGSHLDEESAEKLSRKLGRLLARPGGE